MNRIEAEPLNRSSGMLAPFSTYAMSLPSTGVACASSIPTYVGICPSCSRSGQMPAVIDASQDVVIHVSGCGCHGTLLSA